MFDSPYHFRSSWQAVRCCFLSPFYRQENSALPKVTWPAMQWSQGSNTGYPKPQCASQLPRKQHEQVQNAKMLPGQVQALTSLEQICQECWALAAQEAGPQPQAPGAHQQRHLQTRLGAESGSPIKRAQHTLFKSQALLKTSAGNCVPLIEMKNKLGCQATVERGQEKRSGDKQLVSTSPAPDGHSQSPHKKEPNCGLCRKVGVNVPMCKT